MPIASNATNAKREVAFVDSRIEDWQSLVAGIAPNIEVVLLDGNLDGLKQIANWSSDQIGVSAMHVISHGSEGSIQLGSTTLNAGTLEQYGQSLGTIGKALTAEGDILFYGCNIGVGKEGSALIQSLFKLTEADVAASNDLTGAADEGANWNLEVTHGGVEASSLGDMKSFEGVLAAPSSFSAPTSMNSYSTGRHPFDLAIADINGDGKSDLIVSNINENLTILSGNGDGSFRYPIDHLLTDNTINYVISSDVNCDGKADLIVTYCGSFNSPSGLLTLKNNGLGVFEAGAHYQNSNATVSDLISTDVNGDNKPDLVVFYSNNGDTNFVSVLENNGDGTFGARTDYNIGELYSGIACADVNNDGKADLIVTNTISNTVSLLLNTGDGKFSTGVDYLINPDGRTSCVACADMNDDGFVDILVTHNPDNNSTSGTVVVLQNKGDGDFFKAGELTTGLATFSVIGTDLNGDGLPDIAATNSGDNSITVFTNQGGGGFSRSSIDFGTGYHWLMDLQSADLDGNGLNDLVVADYGSASIYADIPGVVSVLLNSGTKDPLVVVGTAGNDSLQGAYFNHTINGLAGNDTLFSSWGNDSLNGGGGIDTVVARTYTLTKTSTGWTGFSAADGTDTLTSIERLQLTDKKIALDLETTGNAGQAMEFIGAVAPSLLNDVSIRGTIISLFDQGQTMQSLSQLALDLNLLPNTSSAALANAVYQNVVGGTAAPDMTDALVAYIDSHGQANFLATVAGLHLNVDLVGLQQAGGVEYSI